MASAQFVQSDPTGTPPTFGQHCSANVTHASGVASAMDNGAGTTGHVFTVPNDNKKRVYINWVATPGVGAGEPSLVPSNWTVKWRVSSGSVLVKYGGSSICHEDSAGNAIETIASIIPLSPATMNVGTYTETFAEVNPTTWKDGDVVVYTISFFSSAGFGSANITVVFDQVCNYVTAIASFRGVTCGGGYIDRKREGAI